MTATAPPPSSPPTVGCKVIRAALLVAKSAGLDTASLTARYQISQADLADPDARFSHDIWLGLWRDIDASGPGAFGLRAAKALPEHHFDVLDYVMASSNDLREAFHHFERYFAIVSTGSRHIVVDDGELLRIERHYAAGVKTKNPHPPEFAFACLILRTRKMTGVDYAPREVRFAHPAPADLSEHEEVFMCPLVFDADVSAIVVDRATLELPTRKPEPELKRILESHADAVLASLAKTEAPLTTTTTTTTTASTTQNEEAADNVRARAKRAIVDGLKQGQTSVNDIAKKLAMSERTLQRRLGELDTSHAKLLDEVRSELARRYLEEPSVSIAEIAFLLGFSDVSTFHRSFRRWTDCTPAEHRRMKQRELAPARAAITAGD